MTSRPSSLIGQGAVASGEPPVENVNIKAMLSLISPEDLDREMPIGREAAQSVLAARERVKRIIDGEDPRMLAIVGPCSIHDEAAAIEYAQRLAELRAEVSDQLEVLMRVYFEKPRTTIGWKGLINDPNLDGSFDIDTGLRTARRILMRITELGLPTATELLDPITPQYIADLIAWAAVGARTIESQTHRQMASGLSMPVGFKNRTDGDLQVALDAMLAAKHPHRFLGIDNHGRSAVIVTRGNAWGHVILRGGIRGTNFDPESLAEAGQRLEAAGLRPGLMVDCSHANSAKKHQNQRIAWESCIAQRAAGNQQLMGLMLESNLFEGNQKLGENPAQLQYGVSITDECIGWDTTASLVREARDQLAAAGVSSSAGNATA